MNGPCRVVANPDRFFIGGEWVRPSSDARLSVLMPSSEELYIKVAEAQAVDIDLAVAAAREAFDRGPWPRMSPAERANCLNVLGAKITERAADFAQIWSGETGAVKSLGDFLLPMMGLSYQYYAGLAQTFAFEERHTPSFGGKHGLLIREPVGVVAAIVPWNAALLTITLKLAPALLAGCTIVLKSSPEAPGTALLLAEIAKEIGLPPGVLNVVTAEREVSEHLVRHPGVDKVSFTGSSAAGRKIGAICGERIARFTLELGGKSAAVVFDDYDVGAVAASLAQTAPLVTGQVCASLTRVIVTRERHDALVEALSAALSSVKVGDPFDPSTQMGPLAMRRQRDRVEHLIAKGKEEGATLACGGRRPKALDRGFYIEPTVFGHVDNRSTIAREEIFGPVLSVIAAKNEAEAIDIANDSPYGLNASVFTRDPDRAYAAARRLRTGTVGVNAQHGDFGIAFGGFKASGVGREGGVEGLLGFLETKTVILDELPRHLR